MKKLILLLGTCMAICANAGTNYIAGSLQVATNLSVRAQISTRTVVATNVTFQSVTPANYVLPPVNGITLFNSNGLFYSIQNLAGVYTTNGFGNTDYIVADGVVSNALSERLIATNAALVTAIGNASGTAYITADGIVSNGVVTAYTAADDAVSNVLSTRLIATNAALVTAYGSADTTVSNGVVTAYGSADTTVSNGVVTAYGSADNTVSNGLVTLIGAATNGLANYASTNYVNSATNGFTTTAYVNSATNGFTTTAYVNSATNGFTTTTYVNNATNNLIITTNKIDATFYNLLTNTGSGGGGYQTGNSTEATNVNLTVTGNLIASNQTNTTLSVSNAYFSYTSIAAGFDGDGKLIGTNAYIAADTVVSNGVVTAYGSADNTVSNGLVTLIGAATNGFTTTAYVNSATNGFTTTAYVNSATNGLANYASTNYVNSATNGLANYASTNYVNSATNGFTTTAYVNSATNGFTTTTYVNNATNNLIITTNKIDATFYNLLTNTGAGSGGYQTGNSTEATNVNLTVTGNLIASNQTNTTLSVSNAYFSYTSIAAGFDGDGKLIGTNAYIAADNTVSNGLVTLIGAATNGFTTTAYVNSATNGFTTTTYVNNATNNLIITTNKIDATFYNLVTNTGSGTAGALTNNETRAVTLNSDLTVLGNLVAANQTNTTLSVSNAYFSYTNIAAGFDGDGKLIGTNAYIAADTTVSNGLVTLIVAAAQTNISLAAVTDAGNIGYSNAINFHTNGTVIVSPLQRIFPPAPQLMTVGTIAPASNTGYFVYIGKVEKTTTFARVRFQVTSAGNAAATNEVGLFSTPNAPAGTAQTLTRLAASAVQNSTGSTGIKSNITSMDVSIAQGTHLWAGMRSASLSTQPTCVALTYDMLGGAVLTNALINSLTNAANATITGAGIPPFATTSIAPSLRVTLD